MTEKVGFESNRTVHYEWHNNEHDYTQPNGKAIKLRSDEEYRWARYLDLLVRSAHIKDWQYEAETFEFEERYCKREHYTPDFRIVNMDGSVEYHEVKAGFRQWQPVVRKFRRFKADFPRERIILVAPYQPQKGKALDKIDKAKKYVDDLIISGPIFNKLGF